MHQAGSLYRPLLKCSINIFLMLNCARNIPCSLLSILVRNGQGYCILLQKNNLHDTVNFGFCCPVVEENESFLLFLFLQTIKTPSKKAAALLPVIHTIRKVNSFIRPLFIDRIELNYKPCTSSS